MLNRQKGASTYLHQRTGLFTENLLSFASILVIKTMGMINTSGDPMLHRLAVGMLQFQYHIGGIGVGIGITSSICVGIVGKIQLAVAEESFF